MKKFSQKLLSKKSTKYSQQKNKFMVEKSMSSHRLIHLNLLVWNH